VSINASLVAALGELTNPTKDRTANAGPYSYKYADLATVIDHVRPIMAKHDLAVTQNVTVEDGQLQIWTYIHHTSGEVLTYGPVIGRTGGDWQTFGSAVTYARRYALGAALGIAPEDDDDAAEVTSVPRVMERAEKPAKVERSKSKADDDPWQTPPPVDPETGEAATVRPAVAVATALLGATEIQEAPSSSRASIGGATDKQIGFAKRLTMERFPEAIDDETALPVARAILTELDLGALECWEGLTKRQATKLIDALKMGGA